MFTVLLAMYSLGIEAVVWLVLVPLHAMRVFAGTHEWDELRQRLGTGPGPQRSGAAGRLMLVHAVSAGEMMAAEPVVARLAPSPVLLTTHTAAGMAVARLIQTAHPHVDACVFLPWDRRAIRRWLQARRIAAVFVLETEIWPNLFVSCRSLGITLVMANGRLGDREAMRYRLARPFFRSVICCASWIGVQSERDRERFVAMGADEPTVHVEGNLKVDAAPLRHSLLADVLDVEGRVIVGGSTHDPEESWLLDCVQALRDERAVRLVLAPRDVARGQEIVRAAGRRSLTSAFLSDARGNGWATEWDVLIVDEYGWLSTLYERADVVFVGGTIAPVGGHNVIEAARFGRPIIVGPHVSGISEFVHSLASAGGIVQVRGGEFLDDAVCALLDDAGRARAIGQAARDVCRRAEGVADRYWSGISAHLGAALP